MSNLVDYAESEMRLLGYTGEEPEDDPNRWMWDNVLSVVKAFASGGHSGSSAAYAIGIIEKILRYEPLTPLKFTDDEWIKHDEPKLWQNRRKSTVFSADEGKTWYDLDEEGTPRHPIMRNEVG
jgi:hypothetical protein